jgi:predicted nucleotidyltransferase
VVERFIEILRRHMPELRERYRVRSLGVFGSYLRNEGDKGSDLDMLVDFENPPSLLTFIALENFLSDLLQIQVDLVMKDALKPAIGQHILKEVVYI